MNELCKQEWAKALIAPPRPDFTDQEIRAAKLRYGMFQKMAQIGRFAYEVEGQEFTEDHRQRLLDMAVSIHEEALLALADEHDWNEVLEDTGSIHGGDCTMMANTCRRCLAESFFDIPHTGPTSKQEGARAWSIFISDEALQRRLDTMRKELAARQQPLGADFEAALENVTDLYEE